MDGIQIFENQQFGKIRGVTIDGEPWLVGRDVAAALGYTNPQKAIRDHICEEDKTQNELFTVNGTQGILINESGLYSLILGSKLPGAKAFKRWVTAEVLPAIRKTGGYIHGAEGLTDAELMAKALIVAQKTIEERTARVGELEAQIQKDAPKVLFADAVSASDGSILIGELAKLLKQNGIENMGQNRLFAWLRENGYLIRRKGTDYNAPTQKSMELQLFRVKETAITHSDGHITVNKTTKVTGKGQQYFVGKFLKQEAVGTT